MAYEDVTGVFVKLVRDGVTRWRLAEAFQVGVLIWVITGCNLKNGREGQCIWLEARRTGGGADGLFTL